MHYVEMSPEQRDRIEALLRAQYGKPGAELLPLAQLMEDYRALHAWSAQLDAARWKRRDVRYETEDGRKFRDQVACATQANVDAMLRLELAMVERGQPGLEAIRTLFMGDDFHMTLRLVRHAGRYFPDDARPVLERLLQDPAAAVYHDHLRQELGRQRKFAPTLGGGSDPGDAPALAPRGSMEYGFGDATPPRALAAPRWAGPRRRSGRA
jgi:hypothetical protein